MSREFCTGVFKKFALELGSTDGGDECVEGVALIDCWSIPTELRPHFIGGGFALLVRRPDGEAKIVVESIPPTPTTALSVTSSALVGVAFETCD